MIICNVLDANFYASPQAWIASLVAGNGDEGSQTWDFRTPSPYGPSQQPFQQPGDFYGQPGDFYGQAGDWQQHYDGQRYGGQQCDRQQMGMSAGLQYPQHGGQQWVLPPQPTAAQLPAQQRPLSPHPQLCGAHYYSQLVQAEQQPQQRHVPRPRAVPRPVPSPHMRLPSAAGTPVASIQRPL